MKKLQYSKYTAKVIENEKSCETFKLDFTEQVKTFISENIPSFEIVQTFCENETRCGLFPVYFWCITLKKCKIGDRNPNQRYECLIGIPRPQNRREENIRFGIGIPSHRTIPSPKMTDVS